MSFDPVENIELPELIDLPVYREDYISQKRVDELCKLVWDEKQDLLKELATAARGNFKENSGTVLARRIGKIIAFLREEESAEKIDPISMIGMVDFTFELLRRVCLGQGLEDVEPRGVQISETVKGPFPPVGELRNHIWGETDKEPKKYTPEKEALFYKLYDENPEVIFAATELERRWLRFGEPQWFLTNYFKKHLPSEEFVF